MGKEIYVLCWSVDPSGFYGGYTLCRLEVEHVHRYFERLVLLNAVVPGHEKIMYTERIDFPLASIIVDVFKTHGKPIISYIGHESTAKLLSLLLNIDVRVNRGMYEPQHYDLALVFRLKKRLEKPEDIQKVSRKDLEVWMVHYVSLNY